MTWVLALFAAAAEPCVPVDGPRILGRDLERAGLSAGMPPDAVAAFSPAPGVRRTIGVAALRRLAAKYGLPDPPTGVCFERAARPLDTAAALRAMRDALGQPTRIAVIETSPQAVPPGELEFHALSLQPPGRDGISLWRGYVRYEPAKRFPIWARVRVTREAVHLVARAEIAAGARIAADQVEAVTNLEFPAGRAALPLSIQDVSGRRARRQIARGDAIEAGMLEVDRDVEKGQAVEVRVAQGSARLSMSAKAESAGGKGQIVSLRNPASGKLFRGRVEGPGLVVIEK